MEATKQNLKNALVKLERSITTGIDPISGYTTRDILDWIEEHEPFDPIASNEWSTAFTATKNRLGI